MLQSRPSTTHGGQRATLAGRPLKSRRVSTYARPASRIPETLSTRPACASPVRAASSTVPCAHGGEQLVERERPSTVHPRAHGGEPAPETTARTRERVRDLLRRHTPGATCARRGGDELSAGRAGRVDPSRGATSSAERPTTWRRPLLVGPPPSARGGVSMGGTRAASRRHTPERAGRRRAASSGSSAHSGSRPRQARSDGIPPNAGRRSAGASCATRKAGHPRARGEELHHG